MGQGRAGSDPFVLVLVSWCLGQPWCVLSSPDSKNRFAQMWEIIKYYPKGQGEGKTFLARSQRLCLLLLKLSLALNGPYGTLALKFPAESTAWKSLCSIKLLTFSNIHCDVPGH